MNRYALPSSRPAILPSIAFQVTLDAIVLRRTLAPAARVQEQYYTKSLKVRQKVKAAEDKEQKEKMQMCAQSFVSLGNLKVEMKQFAEALAFLEQSKAAYIEGFHPTHPKVAWAFEAMGTCYRTMGDLRKAQVESMPIGSEYASRQSAC